MDGYGLILHLQCDILPMCVLSNASSYGSLNFLVSAHQASVTEDDIKFPPVIG